MIDINLELKNLETSQNSMVQAIGRLEGEKNLLTDQLNTHNDKISNLEENKMNSTKAIELLQCVQRSTRDKIKEAFEQTVTFALRSIYQKDYRFQLEFSQRGNLGELNFKMKSPENEGYLDLEECTAGGSLDVISLALRFALLQIIRPKLEGFVVLDEPTKQLSRDFRRNEYNFYKGLSEKLGRQIIIITHAQELIDQADNKIKVGA